MADYKPLFSIGASARVAIQQLHIHLGDPMRHDASRARMDLHLLIAELPDDLLAEAKRMLDGLVVAQTEPKPTPSDDGPVLLPDYSSTPPR